MNPKLKFAATGRSFGGGVGRRRTNIVGALSLLLMVTILLPWAGQAQGTLTNGGNHDGTITTNEVDSWTFTATAGDNIVLHIAELTDDNGFYPWIRLYGPNGALIGSSYHRVASEISKQMTNSGTFTVFVADGSSGHDKTGTYRLRLARMPDPFVVPNGDEGGAMSNGANHDGRIELGDLDLWTFTASAGDNIVLHIAELTDDNGFYPWIRLYGPNGALIGSSYHQVVSEINKQMTNSGTFTVVVSDASVWGAGQYDRTGTYRLRLARMPDSFIVPNGDEGGALSNGANYDGRIELGDLDLWTFTASAGDNIVLHITELTDDNGFYPWIRLYGTNGALLNSVYGAAAAQITRQATNSGTFTVVVSDASMWGAGQYDRTGTYRLILDGTVSQAFVPFGQVTETGGGAVVGAIVTALRGLTPIAETSTDFLGNYQLARLHPGACAIKVTHPTHASAARALTLSASTARQNFQLTVLPAPPTVVQTARQPPATFTQPPIGPLGSTLKIFDGSQFVAITAGNAPETNRMTIVLTHGWIPTEFGIELVEGIEGWPTDMAAQLRVHGVTPDIANILAWDWHSAAAWPLPPEERTPSQGVALGQALQAALGNSYATNLHFLGHSLGTMANAAAANYLHRDRTGTQRQEVSPTPWQPTRTHVTLFEQAEVSRVASLEVLFDGLTVNLADPTAVLKYVVETLQGWKPSMPVQSAWADNYISYVGFYQPNALNVALQKAADLLGPIQAHGYPMEWYNLSIATPTVPPLGFRRSYEYDRVIGGPATFPPGDSFPLGDAYHQIPSSSDPLALEPLPPENVFQLIVPLFGNKADVIIQGAIGVVHIAGDVVADVRDSAQAAGQWISSGFNYVGNVGTHGGQSLMSLFDSAVLRLRLKTGPAPAQFAQSRGGSGSLDANGGSVSNSPPMAWLPVGIPANATAMAFDFTVDGDPVDDVLVCGIGESNLFSLEAKYIPTNTISSSRLVDVSLWAGTTNELFFGFMCCTSTNATLIIENIRFYSLEQPRLEIARSGSAVLVTWPLTAAGYVVETTPNFSSPMWEAITNAPVISADRYVLTNSWSDQSRFFRLRVR